LHLSTSTIIIFVEVLNNTAVTSRINPATGGEGNFIAHNVIQKLGSHSFESNHLLKGLQQGTLADKPC